MPFIVMTGFPCSTKSTRTEQISLYFKQKYPQVSLTVISDEQFGGFDRKVCYSNSRSEKDLRGYLKSEVHKHLNKDSLVILDSLNYIKGFRYELFCVTKASQTPHCVIWCDISKESAAKLNEAKESNYPPNIMDELIMRYERPDSKNRWDSPLFIIQLEDELPLQSIDEALFKSKAPPPNLSTVAQPLQPTNFMYELDRVASDTIRYILLAQKTSIPGDRIKIPEGGELQLNRHLTTAELHKAKRQFITYMKMNPVTDNTRLTFMFVQYLQTTTMT